MSATPRPAVQLTVIVVVFAGGDAVSNTLSALEPQRQGARIIVVFAEGSLDSAHLMKRFAAVEWVAAPAGTPPARLRALGVARAQLDAPLACTEDHCVPAPDWCARILAAHQNEKPSIVGGAIEKVPTASSASWAAYLLDYSRYLPPFDQGAAHASDCNVSYPPNVLASIRQSWSEEFHETVVHDALRSAGLALRLDPSIVVFEQRTIALGAYLGERVQHGRLYAANRSSHASAVTRARWSAQSVLLPLVLSARVIGRLRARGRTRAIPRGAWSALGASTVAWSLGEFLGYATKRPR
jgi:hypothetical protein